MSAIIFGSAGQDGYYLERLLTQCRIKVTGVSRNSAGRNGAGLTGDVGNYPFVENLIKDLQPRYIFHLAANSTTQHHALFENHQAISTGTLNILESARLHCPTAKVFLSGSAMQFRNEGLPINEQTPFEGSSPYSVARIQSVYAARYYRNTFGLRTYIGYFFNHDSPLRTEKHVNQKIVRAVKRIASGDREKLVLGNIDVRKEFNFAGDFMEAIWRLMNQDAVFEAVIGSGEAHSIREWVAYCFAKTGRNWEDHVEIKQDFVPEYQILVSDPRLIRSLGWTPGTDFNRLADLMMDGE